jgi:uncharacterized protein (DUF2336 family)
MKSSDETSKTKAKEVNILDPKQLLAFAQDTSEAGRSQLTNAVATFFDEHTLNENEQKIASEILVNLVKQAEVDLRQSLAERLSTQENVPADVILFLANDVISVAKPILLHSPLLRDIDLIQIISSRGSEHWRSISQRQELSPVIVDRLIDMNDPETALKLIANERVVFPKNCIRKLVKVSLRSEELQAPLLRRPEIDSDTAIDLYLCVSQALRKEIVERFSIPEAVIDKAIENLVQELSYEAKGIRQVTPEMLTLAQRFMERGEINADLLIKTLRRGQISFFIALFSKKSGFPSDVVVKLVQKEGGKSFTIVCRSLGMMKSEFASIFLLSRGIRTGDKIVDQRELAMVLKYYDSIKDFDVQRIMKSWQKNSDFI